jgi:thioesterase-3
MNYQTDSFELVHHARYLEIMEEGRWMYCHENRLLEPFHRKGIYHVVVNINIDYKGSARFGDLVTIETEVFCVSEKSVIIRQVVSRDDQTLIVADITNVFMRKADNRVIAVKELGVFWQDLQITEL